MSSSDENSAIFLNDTPKSIKKKMNKYAFSGGQADTETHRKYGGNPEVDVAYQYLRFIHGDDDELESLCSVRSRTLHLHGISTVHML